MISLRKLAEIAGVSAMTVSRALRDNPHVRPELRQKIRQLAELYHYHPLHKTESGGESGNLHVIGCLVPEVGSFYYSRVLQGVLEQAYADSCHVITLQTHARLSHCLLAIDALLKQGVAGILLTTLVNAPLPTRALLEMWSAGTAAVGMGLIDTETPLDVVRVDETQIGELMVDYLWKLGHRRIGYIGTFIGNGSSWRGLAICAALERRGASLSAFWEVEGNASGEVFPHLLTMPSPPTALIAFSDFYAIQLIQQAERYGVRVPDDLSVLGCANLVPWVDYIRPAISTIEEHPEELGRRAASLLFRRIAEGLQGERHNPETILLTPCLVPRDTCVPPRLIEETESMPFSPH